MIIDQSTDFGLFKHAIQRRCPYKSRARKNFGSLERKRQEPQLPCVWGKQLDHWGASSERHGPYTRFDADRRTNLSDGICGLSELLIPTSVYGGPAWIGRKFRGRVRWRVITQQATQALAISLCLTRNVQ